NMSRWIAFSVTEIFEEIGVVQDGMITIAKPLQLTDKPDAARLDVRAWHIVFDDVSFGYGRERSLDEDGRRLPYAVLDGFSLDIRPGEKVGLVGRSGAGKSTVVNL